MHTIEIRLAKDEDAPFIALLGRTTFTETFGHFFRDPQDLIDYYNSTFSVQKIEDGIKKPDNVFWIAFANRLPVGYAKLKLNSPSDFVESQDVCQLQKIYVLKDFLSMKIGFGQGIEITMWLSEGRASHPFLRFEQVGNHDFQIGKESFEFVAMSKPL